MAQFFANLLVVYLVVICFIQRAKGNFAVEKIKLSLLESWIPNLVIKKKRCLIHY